MKVLTLSTFSLAAAENCKVIPGNPGWPTTQEWATLNSSIDGRLLAPTPPFASCHPSQPEYNNATCAELAPKFTSSLWHSQQPIGKDYNDIGCLPSAKHPCNPEYYPQYVVRAECAEDVKKGVDFAREHNVRLVVKGTGHDFNSRSSAPRSMSIWTHFLKNFQVHDAFVPQGCHNCTPGKAVTVGAGWRIRELMKQVNDHGLEIVGGADPDVGIAGWLSGAGHGPITHIHGLGADNALEFEVVTPMGQILTVNQAQNSDLFWALRGGGASTYAVVLSITMKAYPASPYQTWLFQYSAPVNSDTYWDLNTYFHSQIPSMNDQGLMGYYFAWADNGPAIKDRSKRATFSGSFLARNMSEAETRKAFQKVTDYVKAHPKISTQEAVVPIPNIYEWYVQNTPQAVGVFGRLGSRLADESALAGDNMILNAALRNSTPGRNILLGHVIAGKGVADAVIPGGSNAVLPAWRKAYSHMIAPTSWNPRDTKMKDKATQELTYVRVAALRELIPDSGSYVSEGDPDEPDWKHAFWGDHYERLLQIKKKYDPHGVLHCFPCVGGDLWVERHDTICKAG